MSIKMMSRAASPAPAFVRPALVVSRSALIVLLGLLVAVAALGGVAIAPSATTPAAPPLVPSEERIVPLAPTLEQLAPPVVPQPAEQGSPSLSQPAFLDSAPATPASQLSPGLAPAGQSAPSGATSPIEPVPAPVPVAPQRNVMTVAPEDRGPVLLPPGASK